MSVLETLVSLRVLYIKRFLIIFMIFFIFIFLFFTCFEKLHYFSYKQLRVIFVIVL